MFWSKKYKCPIDEEDQNWIVHMLRWIDEEIFELTSKQTILPTRKFFDYKFTGIEEDGQYVLDTVGKYFDVDTSEIKLKFYSEENIELDRGLVTKKEEGKGTAGIYEQDEDNIRIWINEIQLKKPVHLIATMAHEMSHYVLMGIHDVTTDSEEEDEWLTDLFTIANGFGIYMGNTKFEFSQWQSGDGWGGWQYSTQGYLPQQIIAHAMAEIEMLRSEKIPEWINHLNGSFQDDFKQSMMYLIHEE